MSGDLTHGGGSSQLSNADITNLSNIQRLRQDPNLDPAVSRQLDLQHDSIVNRDNGGVLGSFGRVMTGQGQTGGEQALGVLLPLGLNVLRNVATVNAMRNSNSNMMNASNQMMNGQRANLMGNAGFFNK